MSSFNINFLNYNYHLALISAVFGVMQSVHCTGAP